MQVFKQGLQLYIDKFKYGNTDTVDLWKALESASGQPVEKIMSTWTRQMGFPLRSVRRVSTQPEKNTSVVGLSQKRFLAVGEGIFVFLITALVALVFLFLIKLP